MAIPAASTELLNDVRGWAYIILHASASEKQISTAYHGLTPKVRAMTRPMAGYQATSPMRENKTISGRFSSRYSNTNKRDTRVWRNIVRCEYMDKNLIAK